MYLKAGWPDQFLFAKLFAELYDFIIVEDSDNVYTADNLKEELKIKTPYERLDIGQNKRIHYLKFTLPATIKNIDDYLQEILRDEE